MFKKQFDKNKKYAIGDKQQLINLFKIPKNSLSYCEKKYSFDDYKCYTLCPLSMRDSKLVNTSAFWDKIIIDARHENKKKGSYIYGNDILQHWCFNDIGFSQMIIQVLLKNINKYHYQMHSSHLDACFSMMKTLMLMDQDNLLSERFNMLLNCDSQCVGKKRTNRTNLSERLGVGTRTIGGYGATVDLIDLIEFYSKTRERTTFRCIDEIFECIKKNKNFGKLMFKIRNDRWKQWDSRIKAGRSQEIWNDYSNVIESFGWKHNSMSFITKPRLNENELFVFQSSL